MLKFLIIVTLLLFLLAGATLVYYHQTYPNLRASMVLGKDLGVAFFTLLGIGAAVENLRRSAQAAKVTIALHFVERWNDPKLADFRKGWHRLYEELKTLKPGDVVTKLEADEPSRVTATDVLNFFEEFAYVVNTKAADEGISNKLLGGTISGYYNVLLPWITKRRETRADAWEQLTTADQKWCKVSAQLPNP